MTKDGNQNAIKHGGESAVKAIQKGDPFHGLATEIEQAVSAELVNNGAYSMIEKNAVRLQTACELYWGAIMKAAETGDLHSLDHYVARYGWLASVSLRAWAQVRQEQRRKDNLTSEVVLEAVQRGKENKSNTD
jgi:hypothetical protein